MSCRQDGGQSKEKPPRWRTTGRGRKSISASARNRRRNVERHHLTLVKFEDCSKTSTRRGGVNDEIVADRSLAAHCLGHEHSTLRSRCEDRRHLSSHRKRGECRPIGQGRRRTWRGNCQ